MAIIYVPVIEIGKYSGYGIREMKIMLKIHRESYSIICHSFNPNIFIDKFKKELVDNNQGIRELQREIPEWIKNRENFYCLNRFKYNKFKKKLGLSKRCNII